MRKYIVQLSAVALFALPLASPHGFAVSKEMVQLQTQVQQLQDMVQHLQTSNDERMGVIVNLVQQNTDNVNRMMGAVNNLQTALKMENDQRGSGTAQISTQIQALNDSVDELKTRIANLTTQMQAIQNQMQNVNGGMPAQPGGAAPMNQAPGGQSPGGRDGSGNAWRTGRGPNSRCASRRSALSERIARLQLSQVRDCGLGICGRGSLLSARPVGRKRPVLHR
jgi:outer membrane murein-binding lipoprotein Lpp